jgi:curved DNA-binding protein CbpA
MNGIENAYLVLQVDPSADFVVIQAAYRALARRYHPDGSAPDARRMDEINRAYDLLRDPVARHRHDALRAGTVKPVPIRPEPRRTVAWAAPRAPSDAVDRHVLDFGRYAGWSIKDLARHDPDYLRWLCRHSSGIRFRDAIARLLPPEPDLQRRASSVA